MHSNLGGGEQMQHEGLLLPKHGCCGYWKSVQECYMEKPVHSSPADSEEDPSVRIAEAAAATSRNLAFSTGRDNLCFIVVRSVLRSVAAYRSIRSKLVRHTTFFFRTRQWFCMISILSHTHHECQWHCKDACPTYSCLTIHLCSGPSLSPQEVWAWSCSAPV